MQKQFFISQSLVARILAGESIKQCFTFASANKDIPRELRHYTGFVFHVYRLEIVMRIPLSFLMLVSYTSCRPVSAAPQHHFDLPIETPPTSFPASSSPAVRTTSSSSTSSICGVRFLLRTHPSLAILFSLPLYLSHVSTFGSIFLSSCVSSFWYNSPMVHHYRNLQAAILASLSTSSSFSSSFFSITSFSSSNRTFSFCSTQLPLLSSIYSSPIHLSTLASSTDTFDTGKKREETHLRSN